MIYPPYQPKSLNNISRTKTLQQNTIQNSVTPDPGDPRKLNKKPKLQQGSSLRSVLASASSGGHRKLNPHKLKYASSLRSALASASSAASAPVSPTTTPPSTPGHTAHAVTANLLRAATPPPAFAQPRPDTALTQDAATSPTRRGRTSSRDVSHTRSGSCPGSPTPRTTARMLPRSDSEDESEDESDE